MGYPRDEDGYIPDTDASNVEIGAVLSQVQDGRERVVAYDSKTLSKCERNYCITQRFLAVKYFMEHYRQYLLGRKFLVRTDHQALIWLFSLKEPKKIARWLEILSVFDFEIQQRPGNKHNNANTKSRHMEDLSDVECSEPTSLACGPCNKCQLRNLDMQGPQIEGKPEYLCKEQRYRQFKQGIRTQKRTYGHLGLRNTKLPN